MNVMIITKQISRTDTEDIFLKKKKQHNPTLGYIHIVENVSVQAQNPALRNPLSMGNHHTKTVDRNTREKKQWRHGALRRQMKRWQQYTFIGQ